MKFLISGGTGLIGKRLTEYLIDIGHSVNILTRNKTLESLNDVKKYYFWDPSIFKIDSNCIENVDVIINLAALIGIPYSYEATKSYYDTNLYGTLNLLESARQNKILQFIQTSTSFITTTLIVL